MRAEICSAEAWMKEALSGMFVVSHPLGILFFPIVFLHVAFSGLPGIAPGGITHNSNAKVVQESPGVCIGVLPVLPCLLVQCHEPSGKESSVVTMQLDQLNRWRSRASLVAGRSSGCWGASSIESWSTERTCTPGMVRTSGCTSRRSCHGLAPPCSC